MTLHATCIATLLVLSQICLAAHEKPAADKPADYSIGTMNIQTLPAMTYFYSAEETNFTDILKTIDKFIPPLVKAVDDGKIITAGPSIFIYLDLVDMSKPFTLQIGRPVKPDAKAFGDFKVRKTAEFKCATILLTGSLAHMHEAYGHLMNEIDKAKLTPSGESREAYLYWEGPDSANNVVQIQMGIK